MQVLVSLCIYVKDQIQREDNPLYYSNRSELICRLCELVYGVMLCTYVCICVCACVHIYKYVCARVSNVVMDD